MLCVCAANGKLSEQQEPKRTAIYQQTIHNFPFSQIENMKYLSPIISAFLFSMAASNDVIPSELTKADQWLEAKDLNQYGDSKDTMYMGGSPLFNEMTGEMKDRLQYLEAKFPEKPWDQAARGAASSSSDSQDDGDFDLAVVDRWLVKKGLNSYGDPEDTMYMGGTPLFNEMTAESKTRESHLLEKFPSKPWLENDL